MLGKTFKVFFFFLGGGLKDNRYRTDRSKDVQSTVLMVDFLRLFGLESFSLV